MTLTLSVCHACGNPTLTLCSAGLITRTASIFSLASLRSRLAFFSESDSAPHTLPFSSSQGSVRKNSGQRIWVAGDKRAHVGSMSACLAITAEGESIRPSSSLNMISVPVFAGGFNIAQDPPPQPIRLPRAQGQLCQEHTVTQPTSFIPGYSYRLNCLSNVWATSIQRHAASFKEGTARPLKAFQRMLGLMAAASSVLQLGLLHMWTPPHNGDSGLCFSPGPLEGPLLAKTRRDPRHGAQKEGCHDKCFQQGLGSAVRGQTDLRPVVRRGVSLHINCLEMLAV